MSLGSLPSKAAQTVESTLTARATTLADRGRSHSMIFTMIGKTFGPLIPDLSKDQNPEIFRKIQTFTRNHDMDLEEI